MIILLTKQRYIRNAPRFDVSNLQVDKADPDFPRPAGFWWFGCSSIEQGILFPTTKPAPAAHDPVSFPTAVETQTLIYPSMILFGEGR